MSSCNCMLSGRKIASYTGTNVCMTIMQNDTYFTRKLCRWRTPSWFFKLIFRGPLCLRWLSARIISVQNLSVWRISALKSSKPAVFSLFVLFLLFLFHLFFFLGTQDLFDLWNWLPLWKIKYFKWMIQKRVNVTHGSNYVSIFLHWLMLNTTLSKPIHLNVSLLYVALL